MSGIVTSVSLGMETDQGGREGGGEQRNEEYPANSGIVNYVMQINKRYAASTIQQGVCDLHLDSAATVVII